MRDYEGIACSSGAVVEYRRIVPFTRAITSFGRRSGITRTLCGFAVHCEASVSGVELINEGLNPVVGVPSSVVT